MAVRYYHRILAPELRLWLSLGWVEVARDQRPSLSVDVVVLEWSGDGSPPVIARPEELDCDQRTRLLARVP